MSAILETTLMPKEPQVMQNELVHEVTKRLAYKFWLERGGPIGSPEDDWFRAEEELRHEGSPSLSEFAMGPDPLCEQGIS